MPLDTALQDHAIARRQLAAALKELAATERRVATAPAEPGDAAHLHRRVETSRRTLHEAEAALAKAPARTVWAFLIKVEALVSETMSADTVAALRSDANALLDSQTTWAA